MADNRANSRPMQRSRRVYAGTESAFNTMFKPVATDAIRVTGGGISPSAPNRILRNDNRESRSAYSYIQGSTPPSEWSYETYLNTSGAAGAPPAYHKLLLAALGTDSYTNTPATSDAYLLTDTCKNRGSLTLYEFYPACGAAADEDGVLAETLTGAIASTMSIKGTGAEPPMISFSGVGSKYASTARSVVGSGGVTAAVVSFDNGGSLNYDVGSLVAFFEAADGTTSVDDNSGVGFKVISVDYSADEITLDASPVGVVATDIVAPFAPAVTLGTETPIAGVNGSLTIDAGQGAGAVSVSPLDYEINLDNTDAPHDNESFQSHMTDWHENVRVLSGQFRFRAKASSLPVINYRTVYSNSTIVLTLGSTAGNIATITVKCELRWSPYEKGADEVVIGAVSFDGRASSVTAKDEFQIVYT